REWRGVRDNPLRNAESRKRLRLRREQIEAAVGALGNGGVRWIVLFQLLVERGGFRGIALPEQVGEFEKSKWPWDKSGFRIGDGAVGFDGVVGFSRAGVKIGELILRHGREFFVAAADELFQFFDGLILLLEIQQREGFVVARESTGIGFGIFVSDGGEFWVRVLRALLTVGVSELAGFGGLAGGANRRVVNLHGFVEA